MATKPTDDIPEWAENLSDPADILDPGEPYRLNGFNVIRQIPVRAYWNWIQRSVGRWLSYLDEALDEEVARLDGRIDANTPAVRYFDSYDAMAAGLEEGEAGVVVDPIHRSGVSSVSPTSADRVYTSGDHVYAFNSSGSAGVTRYTRALTGAETLFPVNPKIGCMSPSGPAFATQASAVVKLNSAGVVDWTAQYDTSGDKIRGIDCDGEIIVAVGDISTAGAGGAGNVKAWDVDGNHLWTTDVDTGAQCNDVHVVGRIVWVAADTGLYPLARSAGTAAAAAIPDDVKSVTGDGDLLYVSHNDGTNKTTSYRPSMDGSTVSSISPVWQVSGRAPEFLGCTDKHLYGVESVDSFVFLKGNGVEAIKIDDALGGNVCGDHGALFFARSGEIGRIDLPARVTLYRRVPSSDDMDQRRYRTNLEPQG